MTNWHGLRDFLLGEIHEVFEGDLDPAVCPINVPSVNELKTLVELHGWAAFGEVYQAIVEEKKIRLLVKCGVPFEEAIKVAGLREVGK